VSKDRRAERHPRATPASTTGFLLRFALLWLAALVVLALAPAIEDWTVRGTLACVRNAGPLVGLRLRMDGDVLYMPAGPPVQVASDCTALMPTALLWAAIVAYPARMRWRLLGLAAGAAILWGYNLIRIMAMLAINDWNATLVGFVPVYVWQSVSTVFACALFFVWVRPAPEH